MWTIKYWGNERKKGKSGQQKRKQERKERDGSNGDLLKKWKGENLKEEEM